LNSLTIGAVARATGLSPDTLRVWQRRYGFPVPERKASGHRLYCPADVRRLRRIADALARGHRPGQVVPLAEASLQTLLGETRAPSREPGRELVSLAAPLALVRRHDPSLTAVLLSDAASLGPIDFLTHRAVPMIDAVGDAWLRGEIGIHHEHFFSQALSDALAAARSPFERAGTGPRITLATLSGETHALGVQMAALVAAVAGLQPHLLGPDIPVPEVVAAAKARRSAAVGVSISISSAGTGSRDQLAALRRTLPAATTLLVGGRGARRSHPPGGCIIVEDLPAFFDWARRFAARGA
jgi:methylmalonyl-CoA mutase cobalamin-binding subunit